MRAESPAHAVLLGFFAFLMLKGSSAMAEWDGAPGRETFGDPTAVDNSAMVTVPLAPPSTEGNPPGSEASGTPDVAALAARLAAVEARRERDLQQVQGSRQEVQRIQQELQAERDANRRLQEQHQQFMQTLVAQRAQPQAEPEPPMSLADVIERVAINGDKDAARRFEQQMARQQSQPTTAAPGDKPLTAQQVGEMIAERDRAGRLRDALVQDLGARHADVLGHPQASQLLTDAYTRAAQNPLIAAVSADPTGAATLDWGGQRWNLHILERAMQDIRAQMQTQGTQQTQAQQTAQTLPNQGGGGNIQRPPTSRESVVAPRGMVTLLQDPRIARAMEALTGHKDPRTQLKDVFEHVPADVRQQWVRQAALGRQEHQRQ